MRSDENNAALCAKAMKGHLGAIQFLELITGILHLWDDLHDKDKEIADEQVDKVFWNALVDLPRNLFYQQNFAALNTTLMVAIQNWFAANEMEDTESEYDKEISFITRSSYVDLVILCSTIVGGYDWAREISPEIRRFWHDETFSGYKENLAKEKMERSNYHGLHGLRRRITTTRT